MVTKRKRVAWWILVLGFAIVATTSCSSDDVKEEPVASDKSIVEVATEDGQFDDLMIALDKTNLKSTLKSSGTYTVFAPTNAAFKDLFEELGVSGIYEIPAQTLYPILLYHVLGFEAKSTDLTTGYVQTLSKNSPGKYPISLFIEVNDGVRLNDRAQVIYADLMAYNGVIHVIDKVLLPPNVVEIAIANSNFSILVSAVVKAGLVETLSGDGPFTIFAPTDAAFEALFTSLGVSGIEDIPAEDLVPILTYHVVSGNIRAADVTSGLVETLNAGNSLEFDVSNSTVTINGDTHVIATDVQGVNGVIHVIDKVLLP